MTSLSPITATLGVALGGGIGAALRYNLGRAMTAWLGVPAVSAFPWATLAANAIGSLAMGVLAGSLARGLGGLYADPLRLIVGVGLLGGFTWCVRWMMCRPTSPKVPDVWQSSFGSSGFALK